MCISTSYALKPLVVDTVKTSLPISPKDLNPVLETQVVISDPKVEERYNQLKNFECEISQEKKRSLAQAIEKEIEIQNLCDTEFLKKSSSMPHSLQKDTSMQNFYLIIKDKGALDASGSLKKYKGALQVPFNTALPPIFVAQGVNKTKNDSIESLTENYNNVVSDIKFQQQLSGNPGIWPIASVAFYQKKLGNFIIPKISIITPMGIPLSKIVLKQIHLPMHKLLDIALQLTYGLRKLHRDGYILGDLKLPNCLFKEDLDGSIVAGLIDFGKKFHFKENYSYPLSEGYYSLLIVTAPELFGNKGFKGDLFKVEIWALGCLFYHIFLKKNFPWGKILAENETCIENQVPLEKVQEMRKMVEETVGKERSTLLKIEKRSILEDCKLLICDLMRLDPELRPDLDMTIDRLEMIKKM